MLIWIWIAWNTRNIFRCWRVLNGDRGVSSRGVVASIHDDAHQRLDAVG
jgi:hypothetical protein